MSVSKARDYKVKKKSSHVSFRADSRKSKGQSKASTDSSNSHIFPALPKRRSWYKFAAVITVIGLPVIAVVLTFFVWQLGNTLNIIAEDNNKFMESTIPDSTKSATAMNAMHKFRSSKMSFGQFINFGQAEAMHEYVEPYSNLRFLNTGLIYSLFLFLIASFCILAMLLYFIWHDKIFHYQYEGLVAKANALVENKVKMRTARLKSAQLLAEKERQRAELLLQDSSHRIGNSLATVSSLLNLQLRQSNDERVKKALTSARDRIQTIAAAHRRLRLNKDMETVCAGDFFNAVIRDIEMGLTIGQRQQISFQTHFEKWYLPARDATTLGIILGELLTNAVKHAFPNEKMGRIFVSFGKLNSKNLRLIVADDGVGLPPRPNKQKNVTSSPYSQGLGKVIISQLALQFNAKPQFTNGKNGGSRIVIPLLHVKAEQKQ